MQRSKVCLLLLAAASFAVAQNEASKTPPVIDIHVHAMESFRDVGPVCPFPMQFLASDAKLTNEYQLGWAHQDCSPALESSKNFDEYMRDLVAEWDRLNVTAVVMGDPKTVKKWIDAAPGRVIPGTSFDDTGPDPKFVPVEELRRSFEQDGFKVMGEVGLQYQGISPSDPSVDKYFALAEELDIPVGIHMGTEEEDARTSRCRSGGDQWEIRCCSKMCWHAIPSCACGSCMRATR